jgi:transcriptional regulator with XRE-family HTH domain
MRARTKSEREAVQSRAQAIDKHVGARVRKRRIMLGLAQQQVAELIGVTYQQLYKYEKGETRVAASRLLKIAQALGVEVSYFFQGMNAEEPLQLTPHQRMLLDLARHFTEMPSRHHQKMISDLARALADPERLPELPLSSAD